MGMVPRTSQGQRQTGKDHEEDGIELTWSGGAGMQVEDGAKALVPLEERGDGGGIDAVGGVSAMDGFSRACLGGKGSPQNETLGVCVGVLANRY